MVSKLFFHIISGILGIFLAIKFVPGVEFSGATQILMLAGTILGLVNFFIKPILKIISLPLRILTLGLFSLVINMILVWLVVDVLFPGDLEIKGLIPLFWTTIIIWALNLIFQVHNPKTTI